jgi:hypothetical protein
LIEVKGEVHEFVATCNSKKGLALKHDSLGLVLVIQVNKDARHAGEMDPLKLILILIV